MRVVVVVAPHDEPFRARALAEPALQRTDSTEVGLNKNNNNGARQAK